MLGGAASEGCLNTVGVASDGWGMVNSFSKLKVKVSLKDIDWSRGWEPVFSVYCHFLMQCLSVSS